jgi:hypothetical protein
MYILTHVLYCGRFFSTRYKLIILLQVMLLHTLYIFVYMHFIHWSVVGVCIYCIVDVFYYIVIVYLLHETTRYTRVGYKVVATLL